jgi:hypothetical protein
MSGARAAAERLFAALKQDSELPVTAYHDDIMTLVKYLGVISEEASKINKDQYLKQVEEAYKAQGQVTAIVGLYLTSPFAGTERSAALADAIRDDSRDLEEKLRELYQVERP